MIPFRVSTEAFWPSRISLAWVSAICSSAFSLAWATFATTRPGCDPLTHLQRHFLNYAVGSRANRQLRELLLFQFPCSL